jgi:CBS domain-containing protein
MKVKDLMTVPVQSCTKHDSLAHAAQIMWEADCGCVPVTDDARRVIAMVTDRDACMAAYTQGKPLSAIPVEHAMSKQLFACSPDDLVADAEDTMCARQVRRLPVTDAHGQLVGILSLHDIVRHAHRDRRLLDALRRQDGLGVGAITRTLEAIGSPRAEPGRAPALGKPTPASMASPAAE